MPDSYMCTLPSEANLGLTIRFAKPFVLSEKCICKKEEPDLLIKKVMKPESTKIPRYNNNKNWIHFLKNGRLSFVKTIENRGKKTKKKKDTWKFLNC